jgi:type I restriction enzyme S subunit
MPPTTLIDEFAKIVNNNFSLKQNLISQNEFLMKTRDMLLPRLISGKLSVENLDIQFPPSMQPQEET